MPDLPEGKRFRTSSLGLTCRSHVLASWMLSARSLLRLPTAIDVGSQGANCLPLRGGFNDPEHRRRSHLRPGIFAAVRDNARIRECWSRSISHAYTHPERALPGRVVVRY